nr:unnamed protein product [Callosobruchus chinensis]
MEDVTIFSDIFYPIKYVVAKRKVRHYQKKWKKYIHRLGDVLETRILIPNEHHVNIQNFYGADQHGNSLSLKFAIGNNNIVEIFVSLRLKNGCTYVFPDHNYMIETNLAKQQWKAKGLEIEVLEPFKRLRIIFNGVLHNVSSQQNEHVIFKFIFNSAASPRFIPHDVDDGQLTNSLAKEYWRDGTWSSLLQGQIGFDQFGALKGLVKFGNTSEEHYLNLPCCRSKEFGVGDKFVASRSLKAFIVDDYGNLIHFVLKSFKNGCSQMNYGNVYTSDYKLLTLKDIDIKFIDVAPHQIVPEMMTVHVKVENKVFKCILDLQQNRTTIGVIDRKYGYEIFNVPAECDVNCSLGNAVVECWYKRAGTSLYIPIPRLHEKTVSSLPNDLIVDIKSDDAKLLKITGGKGNSLALLASLNSVTFSVPEGFIVTVNSYRKQLSKHIDLQKAISLVDDICCGRIKGNLEDVCRESVELFKSSKLSAEVEKAIKNQLRKYDSDMKCGWAVRSSAIGEDSEELSAAGQNDTFLGCQSVEKILDSIQACWGSLFTYQSVKYRWQHGLPILSDMAVVVQKMVPADCAGVLFTCHPTTCNPLEMVVTSNFGLGETVVSGESDPDTFVLKKTWDGKIIASSSSLGLKNRVMKMSSDGVKEVSNTKDGQLSLTDKQVLLLGRVGVDLEELFGNPRDIEWAFHEDKLYILQSRPITTLNIWSEYEFDHETDSPILTDHSVLTVANLKEVVPNGMTVLTETSIMKTVDASVQKTAHKQYDPYSTTGIRPFMHNAMMDVVVTMHRNVAKKIQTSSIILDLAIVGHPVLDNKLNEILIRRNGITPLTTKLKEFSRAIKAVLQNKRILQKSIDACNKINLEELTNGPMNMMYRKITEALVDLETVATCHSTTSTVSVFYQVIVMNVLLEGKSELSTDHYVDFASILSSCEDVVSAEIPTHLMEISRIVQEHGLAEEFCRLQADKAMEWLEENCSDAHKELHNFLKKHGHRNLGEVRCFLFNNKVGSDVSNYSHSLKLNLLHTGFP